MANSKNNRSPIHIDECLKVKRDLGLAHCGVVFAQYSTRGADVTTPLTARQRDQVKVGLSTAQRVMGNITEKLPEAKSALKPEIRKAKAAISKAKKLADAMPKRLTANQYVDLVTAIDKAVDANRNMDTAADAVCRKGRS
jgi:hypothetical protein